MDNNKLSTIAQSGLSRIYCLSWFLFYDTRREFWLNNDYYKTRMEENAKVDAALLDKFIGKNLIYP